MKGLPQVYVQLLSIMEKGLYYHYFDSCTEMCISVMCLVLMFYRLSPIEEINNTENFLVDVKLYLNFFLLFNLFGVVSYVLLCLGRSLDLQSNSDL